MRGTDNYRRGGWKQKNNGDFNKVQTIQRKYDCTGKKKKRKKKGTKRTGGRQLENEERQQRKKKGEMGGCGKGQ